MLSGYFYVTFTVMIPLMSVTMGGAPVGNLVANDWLMLPINSFLSLIFHCDTFTFQTCHLWPNSPN